MKLYNNSVFGNRIRFVSRKNARTNMTAGKVSEREFLYLCLLKMTGELFGIEEKPIRKKIPDLCNGIANFIRLSAAFPIIAKPLSSAHDRLP